MNDFLDVVFVQMVLCRSIVWHSIELRSAVGPTLAHFWPSIDLVPLDQISRLACYCNKTILPISDTIIHLQKNGKNICNKQQSDFLYTNSNICHLPEYNLYFNKHLCPGWSNGTKSIEYPWIQWVLIERRTIKRRSTLQMWFTAFVLL